MRIRSGATWWKRAKSSATRPRQRHHDLPVIGVLPRHQLAEHVIPRHHAMQSRASAAAASAAAAAPSAPSPRPTSRRADGRCRSTSPRPCRGSRPAAARPVSPPPPRRTPAGNGRGGPGGRPWAGPRRGAENSRDTTWISCPRCGQLLGQAIGPLLQAAAERIEAFDDQADLHGGAPNRRCMTRTLRITAPIRRLSRRRSFRTPK